MKKLLYLSNSIIPSQYANSVHVMKMCQAFQNTSFEVELICYTTQENFLENEIFKKYGIENKFNIKALFLKNMRGKFFQKFFQIFKLLNSYNKDTMIYGRDVYSVYLASLLGFDVIYESHGLPNTNLYGMTENQLLKSSKLKKLVLISDKLKDLYLKTSVLKDDQKILVLHDGADELDILKQGIDLGKGVHIGYIGSLYYEGRGIDIILEVAKLNPTFNFHLVGGKIEEVEYWKQKATQNVKFYGFLSHSEAIGYLLSFDIVLMPYQRNLKLEDNKVNTSSWMSPMKMFEYMSAKKAIVSSNLPVVQEVLNDSNSILIKPDDVEEWSNVINKLYINKNFRESIAINAYNDFIGRYTWNNRAQYISNIKGKMKYKKKCPACLGEVEDFLSLDKNKLVKFIEYSKKYYNGLLHSWLNELEPVLMKCYKCGHTFYKNMPTETQLSVMYSSTIRESLTDPARAPSQHMINTMKKIYKMVNKNSPLLLDYGAGYSRWSNAAAIVGFKVIAYEPHSTRTIQSSSYTLVTDSKELLQYKFDFIWLEQVLEHTVEPDNILNDIYKYMNKDTILRLTVPNIARAKEKNKIWAEWPYNGKSNHTMAPYQHLQGFNQKSLYELVNRLGYCSYINKELIYAEFLYLIRFYIGKYIPNLSTTKLYLKLKNYSVTK